MADLQSLLQFIQAIEHQNASRSPYELANILRGYTKPAYTSKMWTIATGYEQPFIESKLDHTVNLAGEGTDFGHFIAALADQINQPGVRLSDFTRWTGDHTSWAGDIGSAIASFRTQTPPPTIPTLVEALNRFASDTDHTANLAAFVVGDAINSRRSGLISQAIAAYQEIPYAHHVRTFITRRLQGRLLGDQLENAADLEGEIRRAVFAYLELSPADSTVLQTVKGLIKLQPNLDFRQQRATMGADLLQGSLHFFSHLVRKGELAPLRFKPYQLPQAPWLGTVRYEVTVTR